MNALALCLLILSVVGQSNQPSPGVGENKSSPPQAKSAKRHQIAKSNEAPAQAPAPPGLQTAPVPREEKSSNVTNEAVKKTTPDWWLVAFTGALVLVGLLQF